MFIRLIKSFTYTRQVYKISRQLGSSSGLDLGGKSTERAIESMKKLWKSNDMLSPLLREHSVNAEDLAEYYWSLSLNGAGQWVAGYYVAVASLCFPFPLQYVLDNMNSKSVSDMAYTLLEYFEQGNPYLPFRVRRDDA